MNNTNNLESENEPLDSSNQLKRRISIDHKVQSPPEMNPSFQNQKSTGSASVDSGVESGFEPTWNKKNSDEQLKPTIEYIVYPQRWWILFTVVIKIISITIFPLKEFSPQKNKTTNCEKLT